MTQYILVADGLMSDLDCFGEVSLPTISPAYLWNPVNRAVLEGDRASFTTRFGATKFGIGKFLLMLLVVLWLTASMGLLYVLEMRSLQLALFGIEAQAQVTSHYTSDDSEGGTDYHLAYQFSIPGHDKIYRNTNEVSRGIYDQTPDDSSIAVVYAPGFPEMSQVRSETFPIPWITLGSLIAAYFVGRYLWRKRSRIARLRRDGQVVQAKLLSCTAKRVDGGESDDYYDIVFTLTFCTPDQRIGTGAVHKRLSVSDYRKFIAPAYGRRMVLLYINDTLYEML
jgi:hypothetical protein